MPKIKDNNRYMGLKAKIFFPIVIILLFLLILEVIIRSINFLPIFSKNEFIAVQRKIFKRTGFESGLYIRDPLLFWRFKPSYRFILKDSDLVEYSINSKGLRNTEFSDIPNRDTMRIICLGDSSTFGFGVNVDDSYPKKLEAILNKYPIYKKHFEVINAGIPGYSSFQGQQWFGSELFKYQPELITVWYGHNDNEFPSPLDHPDKEFTIQSSCIIKLLNFLNHFKTYQLLEKLILALQVNIADKNFAHIKSFLANRHFQRVSKEDMAENITQIIDKAKVEGTEVILLSQEGGWITSVVKKCAEKNHILFVDIAEINKKNNLLLDDCHPNTEGHSLIAEKIFRKMQEARVINKTLE